MVYVPEGSESSQISSSEEESEKSESESDLNMVPPSAGGFRREPTLDSEENKGPTYAGINLKIEGNKMKRRWPAFRTALKADIQRWEFTQTLTDLIEDPNRKR